jgi:hypothetical protein
MKMNDPLQTLYQLMSGRQPAAVTCISDCRWGDWRPHIAMILSNNSHKPDLDRKSLGHLGDTLGKASLIIFWGLRIRRPSISEIKKKHFFPTFNILKAEWYVSCL